MRRFPLRPVILLGLLALTACSATDDTVTVRGLDIDASTPTPSAAPTTIAAAEAAADAPTTTTTNDALQSVVAARDVIFLRGTELLRLPAGASEPEILVPFVDSDDIYFLEDQGYLLYSVVDGFVNDVIAYNLATGDTAELMSIRSNFFVGGGTPYAEWVTLSPAEWVTLSPGGRTLFLYRLDGSGMIEEAFTDAVWLEGDEGLLIDGDWQRVDDEPVFRTNRAVRISMPDGAILETYEDEALTGYEYASGSYHGYQLTDFLGLDVNAEATPSVAFGGSNTATANANVRYEVRGNQRRDTLCTTLNVIQTDFSDSVEDPTETEIYTTEDASRLLVRPLPNGDALLFEWRVPDCGLTAPPVVTVQRYINATGELQALPVALFGGLAFNEKTGSGAFQLSDDGRLLLWVGGSTEARTISLNVLDLDTGETLTLYETELPRGVEPAYIYQAFWG
jgi:hypothetical protein